MEKLPKFLLAKQDASKFQKSARTFIIHPRTPFLMAEVLTFKNAREMHNALRELVPGTWNDALLIQPTLLSLNFIDESAKEAWLEKAKVNDWTKRHRDSVIGASESLSIEERNSRLKLRPEEDLRDFVLADYLKDEALRQWDHEIHQILRRMADWYKAEVFAKHSVGS